MFEYLEVTTDATDTGSPIDGIPDITADGVATCTVTITQKDMDGNTDTGATTSIHLTTTGGNLDNSELILVAGVATATLTSVSEQKCVAVTARDAADVVFGNVLQIQFK